MRLTSIWQTFRGWIGSIGTTSLRSATLMRRILVDRARKPIAGKRGERLQGIDMEQALDVSSKRPAEIVALDDPLPELARLAPAKARIVELMFFAGLGVEGDG